MAGGDGVAIIGAGAAGLAAARRLMAAGLAPIVLESRTRIGGRAHTMHHAGLPLDLGCEWLHSADRNPWVGIARASGFPVSDRPAPWQRRYGGLNFPAADENAYRATSTAFLERIDDAAARGEEGPAADWLEPGNRWNPLMNAFSSYYNGTEWHRVSITDFHRYVDTELNWRVPMGYGAVIAAYGADVPVRLGCPVTCIDHAGAGLRLETPEGAVEARQVIVTVPPTLLVAGRLRFRPALPDKLNAAQGLPLGVANKVFLAVSDENALPENAHAFGHTDRAETASYHTRPYGRPTVLGYFGGAYATALERQGPAAFADAAIEELVGLFGSGVRRILSPIRTTAWADDPDALGAYSHALPGRADDRARLAEPVQDRIFFAGEACSRQHFSTAHGAYLTGVDAAEAVLATMGLAASLAG